MPVLRPSGSDFTSFVKAAAQYVPAGRAGKPSKSGGVPVTLPGLGAIVRASQVGALASPTTSAVVINGVTPPAGGGGPPPLPFVPTSIGSAKLWLDANDPSGTGTDPVNGQAITTWVNKTTGFLNLTGSASISNYGGRNSMIFPPTTGRMYTTTSSVSMPSVTCFMVWLQTAQHHNNGLFGLGNGAISWQEDLLGFFIDAGAGVPMPGGVSAYRIYGGSVVGSSYITANSTEVVPLNILEITTDGATTSVYANGTLLQSASQSKSWGGLVTSFGFGEYFTVSGGGPPDTYISEFLIYGSVLTATQRQTIEGYLAWKWGLQSTLPAGHPFKTAAPTA